MGCGVGRRHGSDPALLWPWYRPAATVPVRPLAWVPPYATGTALEKAKKKTKKKKRVPIVAQQLQNQLGTTGFGFNPGLTQWAKDLVLP